jgi:hypothetical protein
MPAISIFTFKKNFTPEKICELLDKKRVKDSWFNAKQSKYCDKEVFIQYWYYEDVEEFVKKVLSEEDAYELISFLKQNGKSKILRCCYCFINLETKTLEIYRGTDKKREEILTALEKILDVKFEPLLIESKVLKRIYLKHASELKKAVLKNLDGLEFEILVGNSLEQNKFFNDCLRKYPNNLKSITFKPKISFLNSNAKYNVTVNENGVISFSSEGLFRWRPRHEIRQILYAIHYCNNIKN